ncbi:MAG TPA: TolC family protein [Acidobacteriota bacterium]|nr:TolC family protein [Acidobacteriota bacterium]
MKMKLIIVTAVGCAMSVLSSSRTAEAQPPPHREQSPDAAIALTLTEAVARTLAHNPDLKIAAQDIRIAEADVRQARVIPNPEIEWEGEDISGSMGGLGSSAHTIVLSQTIELGGKRSSRTRQAESHVTVAEADFEAAHLDVLAELAARFTRALVAQQRVELRIAGIRLAEELRDAAREKVAVGATATVEAIRADVALSNARIDSARGWSEATNARRQLAAMWGGTEPDFDSVTGDLPTCAPPPDVSVLLRAGDETPRVRHWSAAMQRAQNNLAAERASAVPDITISAGPRFFAENGNRTFVFGLSLPIPLFNRNQGAVVGARRKIEQAEWQYDAARTQWRSDLLTTHEEMTAAYNEATTIAEQVIPQAEAAFIEIQRGYRQGRFGYLDLLAAEQDLIAARERLLDAHGDYLMRRIAIECLIGQTIDDIGEHDDR